MLLPPQQFRLLLMVMQMNNDMIIPNPKKIKILRGSTILKFNWKEVTTGKKMEQNIFVENGDHIIVP